jgi:hypothetical protein
MISTSTHRYLGWNVDERRSQLRFAGASAAATRNELSGKNDAALNFLRSIEHRYESVNGDFTQNAAGLANSGE